MGRPGMGRDKHHGHQSPVRAKIGAFDEHDLANERQGANRLQANDQTQVRNQRRNAPKVGGANGKSKGAKKR